MLSNQLSKETVDFIAREIAQSVELPIIKLGLHYRNQGHVYNVTVDDAAIHGIVQDKMAHRVSLDLDFLSYSSCTCHKSELCEHIIAVFFYAYAAFYNPRDYIHTLESAVKPAAKKAVSASLSLETGTVEQWQEHMQDLYSRQLTHTYNPFQYISDCLPTILASAKSWNKESKQLYTLYTLLFLLQKTEEAKQQIALASTFYQYQYTLVIDELLDRLFHVLNTLNIERLHQEYTPYLEPFIAILAKLCFPTTHSPIDWLTIYRFFWNTLLCQPAWIQAEITRLTQELKKKDMNSLQKDHTLLARVHFYVLAGQDEEALQQWEKTAAQKLENLLHYIHVFHQSNQWERMLVWLRTLRPYLSKADHEEFNFLCECWADTATELHIEEEYLMLLRSLLPQSTPFYMRYLFETERYKQWIDIHLALGASPLMMYKESLSKIEKYDSTLLLPLYHQAIERLILEKKRPAYKDSVKLLKKLRTYYRKLKQQPVWDTYITRLTERHARLRAFQEELQKGKLLP
ncbi:SWIM zinc finger family protein [Aneurinibacillus uraniidurans]|uniref:SWIM zinc finger family protein n=1 Tax=Aneurinibacillus uraniidurans TaxID=2966586 RepID=UPI002349D8B8|nr:SWIM zinc finger family protein [Aneurinibacillus sp. B1]WCN37420.1 SWIM zinc finger domain-containing protein [Aneurinibacillus sp. B1]